MGTIESRDGTPVQIVSQLHNPRLLNRQTPDIGIIPDLMKPPDLSD
ncbi:hypothetical protein [Gluconacetobacter liquefaciens]|uniref:Uncharacterized protein n=1 Tax=Gluconacetobacter liquefaciens TaxID=89584 RepID=A0A7W4JJ90_GLULI|nr:hypothetical protein [Gluconacetobacter liquefaciens]MBB2185799.1 hypothetical protein [Gluconacetobacter liquefaciens]